jgi:hypothetical protein
VPQRWARRPPDPLQTGASSPLERLQQRYPQKGGCASIRQVRRAWGSAFEAGPAVGKIAVSRHTIPLRAHSRRRGTCSPASQNTGLHASSSCPFFKPDCLEVLACSVCQCLDLSIARRSEAQNPLFRIYHVSNAGIYLHFIRHACIYLHFTW